MAGGGRVYGCADAGGSGAVAADFGDEGVTSHTAHIDLHRCADTRFSLASDNHAGVILFELELLHEIPVDCCDRETDTGKLQGVYHVSCFVSGDFKP